MIEISSATRTRSTIAPTKYLPVPPPIVCEGTLPSAPYSGTGGEPALSGGPTPYEERYRIEGDLGRGLYLHYQLPVRVWIEGAEFVAEQPQLRLHAFGDDQTEAILNLRDEIGEHYMRLEGLGERLSSALKRDRALLRKLLARDA
jgi:hypothetical protein